MNQVCKLSDRFAEMSFNESLRRNLRVDEAQFSIPKFLSLWPLLIYNLNIVLTMHLFTGFVQGGDYDRAVEEGSLGRFRRSRRSLSSQCTRDYKVRLTPMSIPKDAIFSI